MISIICPFYNEEENLGELFERLTVMTAQLDELWEIIFVDDGSKDSGPAILENLAQDFENILTIRLDSNRGLTSALHAGFHAANGEILATLDADLQNPPEEIPRLLALLPGCDMVTGYRAKRKDTLIKRTCSLLANFIRRMVLRDGIRDAGCSLRVFRREVLDAFFPYKDMHRIFPAAADRQNFRIRQVPVDHAPRKAGKSKYHFFNRLRPFWDLITVSWLLKNKIRYQTKESRSSVPKPYR